MAFALCAPRPVFAQQPANGDRALPALGHVPLAAPGQAAEVAAASTLGFGYTEPQSAGDGSHERLSARLALSAYATRWLAVGLLADGRYDRHTRDAGGIDDGWQLHPELTTRASTELGKVRVGLDLTAWTPGGKDVGASFGAVGLDTRLLASYPKGRFEFAGVAGFRVDRSAGAAGNVAAMRRGDRIALGASDFDAVLAGLGGSYHWDHTEWFGEASADLLVGSGAPSVSESPIRVTTGVRQTLGQSRFSAEILLDVLLSGRPSSAPTAPLAPVEPRFVASLGLRYRFGSTGEEASSSAPPLPPEPPPEPPPGQLIKDLPPETTLELSLTDERKQPLENAKVELSVGDQRLPLQSSGPGRYRLQNAPSGHAHLFIHSEGRQDVERELDLKSGSTLELDIQSQTALPAGQVRGLVRSFTGKALSAKVRVEPGGGETTTDAEGFFQIDVPPGDYEVVIEAPGFSAQRRKAHVDEHGVVIVNADLSRGR